MTAMMAAIVCAVLSGARGYAAIAQWVRAQPAAVWHLLGFRRRPPTRNAYRALLLRLRSEEFERAIREWVGAYLGETVSDEMLSAVAMDGKTLCGTLSAHRRAVHLLALYDQRTGSVLSQRAVDPKTNEPKAALELLKTVVLKGRVVTADAIFCQREVCQEVVDSDGHYFVVVKDNQPELKAAIAAEFTAAFSPDERTSAGSVA